MEKLSEILAEKYSERFKRTQKSKRGSELDAMLEEIGKVIQFTERYGHGFWRKLLSTKNVNYGSLMGILKQIQGMNEKYPKGATLVNIIKKLPKKKPETIMTLFGPQEKTKRVIHKKKTEKQKC